MAYVVVVFYIPPIANIVKINSIKYRDRASVSRNPGCFGPGSFRPGSFRPNLGVGRFGLGRWVDSALGRFGPGSFRPKIDR